MKEIDFYEKELNNLIDKNRDFAVNIDRKNRHYVICDCTETDCEVCLFGSNMPCNALKLKWLMSEHKEYPILTKYQYEVLNYALTWYKYIAIDKHDFIFFFEKKPKKGNESWIVSDGELAYLGKPFNNFNFINWEDQEPWNIKELIDNCEVEDDK